MGAQVLVENSSFTDVERAIVTNLDSDEEGFANERNNLLTNSTTQITQKVRQSTTAGVESMPLTICRAPGPPATSTLPTLLPLFATSLPSLLVLVLSPSKRLLKKKDLHMMAVSLKEHPRADSHCIGKVGWNLALCTYNPCIYSILLPPPSSTLKAIHLSRESLLQYSRLQATRLDLARST